jgi:hypothetical protein
MEVSGELHAPDKAASTTTAQEAGWDSELFAHFGEEKKYFAPAKH